MAKNALFKRGPFLWRHRSEKVNVKRKNSDGMLIKSKKEAGKYFLPGFVIK